MFKHTHILVMSLCLTVIFSQAGMSGASTQNPLRLDQLKKEILPTPHGFLKHGIHFYDFAIQLPAQVSLNLYDSSKVRIATVQLSENTFEQRSLYKIKRLDGDEAWVSSERQETDAYHLYKAKASTGEAIKIRFATASSIKLNRSKMPITTIEVAGTEDWNELSMSDMKNRSPQKANPEIESEAHTLSENNPLSRLEDERLFTTPTLKILQEVLRSFAVLQESALSKQKSGITTQEYLPEGGACAARCFRIATLVPVYVCDDGFWNGCNCASSQGFWLIAECGISLVCNVECSRFSGGIITE